MLQGSDMWVVDRKKLCLEHGCGGKASGSRNRRLSMAVTVALDSSPARKALVNSGNAKALQTSAKNYGFDVTSRQAQRFVRKVSVTSWELYVLEMIHLESFFDYLRKTDPTGSYFLEKQDDKYNGVEVSTFRRYFCSMGAVRQFLNTDLLHVLAFDAAHMKHAFGGVCLAAVFVTANMKIVPLAWALVSSEDEENCAWFVSQVVEILGEHKFVWFSDQGTAILCEQVEKVLRRHGHVRSLCAKHLIRTLEVMKQSGKLKGSLKGIRFLIYKWARSRTEDFARTVMQEIKSVNKGVAAYLEERKSLILAAEFLGKGTSRGGRITDQLIESFFNMVMPFREKGPVDGILWMFKRWEQVQDGERAALQSWSRPQYQGMRAGGLAMNASRKFFNATCNADKYSVNITKQNTRSIVGVVADEEGRVREIRLDRQSDGTISVSCPCMEWEETGLPCARATRLLAAAGWCREGFPEGCFKPYLLKRTWEEQSKISIPHLTTPQWLSDQARQNPVKVLRAMPLTLLPGRIPGIAGRPKERNRQRKTINSHHKRWKPQFEPSRRRSTAVVDEIEGDDEEIDPAFDVDVEEGDELEDSSEEGPSDASCEEDREEAEENVPLALEGEQSVSAVWAWGSGKRVSSTASLCSCCGEEGHKWPTCRKRNIEFMLVSLGVMEPSKEPLLENQRISDAQEAHIMVEQEVFKQQKVKDKNRSKKTRMKRSKNDTSSTKSGMKKSKTR